jgi:hypothetical protein
MLDEHEVRDVPLFASAGGELPLKIECRAPGETPGPVDDYFPRSSSIMASYDR